MLPSGSKNPEANELYHRVAIAADRVFEYVEAIVLTAAYAFLSIRMDDTSILDFLRYAVRYFLLQQQSYSWGMTKTIQNQR